MRVPLLPVAIALSVVLLVGILALGPGLRGGGPGAILGGTCTGISFVDKPDPLEIIDPEFGTSSKPIDFSMQPDCSGASLQGTWDATFLQRETGLGFGTDFVMKMDADPQVLVYTPFNQQATLEEFVPGEYQAIGCVPGSRPAGEGWRTVKTGTLNCGYGPIPYTSLWGREVGVKGILLQPEARWNVTVTFATTAGQTISKRISTGQTSATWELEGKTVARCSWAGYVLATGEEPPDPRTVVAAYSVFDKRWRLGTEAEWLAYQSARTQLDALLSSGSLFGGVPAAASTSAAYALITDPEAPFPVPGRWASDGSGFLVDSAPVVQRPVLRCRISGEFLGRVEPTGEPTLVFRGAATALYAGSPGKLLFTAGNRGNFTGGFELQTICNGAPVLAAPDRFSLAPGQTVDREMPFTASQPGNYNCEGVLTDVTSGAAGKQARAVRVLAVQTCQPGQTRFIGLFTLERCGSDGSGWATALGCYTGQTISVNTNTCVSLDAARAAGQDLNGSNSCLYRVDAADGSSTTEQGVLLKRDVLYNVQTAPVIYDTAKNSYSCGGVNTPGATFSAALPGSTPAPTQTPVPAPRPTASPPTMAPSGGAAPPTPGFEAVFAVAGLLAVSYIVSRRRGEDG